MPSEFEQLAAKVLVEERFLAIEREEMIDTEDVRRRAARRLQNHPDAARLLFRHAIDAAADEMQTEGSSEPHVWEDSARL